MSTGPNSRLRASLILVTVILCALFLAQGASRWMAASLLQEGQETGPAWGSTSERAQPVEPRRYDPTPLLRRNIFDSAQGDLTASSEPELELGSEQLSPWDADAALPRCAGALRLVGAVASSDDWGIAAIVGSTGETSFHRRGSLVDDATVLGIGPDSVVVQPAGEPACLLEMFAYSTAPSLRQASASKPRPKKKPKDADIRGPKIKRDRNAGLSEDEIAQGIQRISDSRFVIKRRILDKVLDNPGKLMDIARIRPHQEGGKTVGMKVARIRPDTLLTKLGIKNGDVLTGIDGKELSSPDTALQAYASLRTAESLSLTVRRKGSPMTIQYSLQ